MKLKKLLLLAPLSVLSLTSCGGQKQYDVKDYQIIAKHARFNDKGLKILHFSDVHLSTNCDREVQYKFIQKTIDMANAYAKEKDGKDKVDMIVVTGDAFIFATKDIVREFCNFMDKQEIDWTITFGNHDEQCYFSIDWLSTYLNNLSKNENSYLLFRDLQDDNVFGNANFFIDVPGTDGTTIKERLYIIDSNRYKYTFGSYGYDNIHQDQVDWYERCVKSKQDVKSMAFFHIPFEEYKTYYEDAVGGKTKAEFLYDENIQSKDLLDRKGEGISCPKVDSNMFEKMVELQNTKAVFVGHDHKNNFSLKTKDKGDNGNMILSYSVKATDSVGASEDLMGGQVITVTGNGVGDIAIHPITHTYEK